MNIAFFLKPKVSISFLYSDFTLRQALEKMKRSGYTALPVIDRDGRYFGTISEGDFLWYFSDCLNKSIEINRKLLEEVRLNKIIKKGAYESVKIAADIDALLNVALNQNFVPVTDDLGSFIGIVTRRDIIKHYTLNAAPSVKEST